MNDRYALELAVGLVKRAAGVIMAVRARGFAVGAKPDNSPVTEADRSAERLITEALRAATPDVPVVAEEEESGQDRAAPEGAFWLVDPLDGTREFAAGRDDFTVNIGLVRDGRPVLGAVALPAYDEVFSGIVGEGAWKETPHGRQMIAARSPPPEGLTVMASRHYADDPKLAAMLRTVPVAKLTNVGSAVKFMRVAEGMADFYPRMGRTMEWDTAAPQAVLEAAGGSVNLMDGGALLYGKPNWVNPPFLCRGR